MPGRVRIVPAVYVDKTPEIVCDADGVLITNQLGDTVHSWRMSRHKALGIAANISAAVALWERDQKRVEPDNVRAFAHRSVKKVAPPHSA